MYFKKRRWALVGNAWGSFAQAESDDIDQLLAKSTIASDDEVKKYIKESESRDALYRLVYDEAKQELRMRRKPK
jgi:hypothetical protein